MSGPAGKCFYEVLGVHPHAQKQEIKNAYRRLALRLHPDKNQDNPSAKELFQEIQAAYEALSEDDKRAKYDTTARFAPSHPSTRAWREPSYEPCNAYTEDPPFWSAELCEMTVQKCARIAKIQHLEHEIYGLVVLLDALIDTENRAVSKEHQTQAWLSLIKSHSKKVNAQRHHDFLTKSAHINTHLNRVKDELRTAHEEHRKMLEKDNMRKTWWARERVRRVDEENRRAATTAAEAARRRAERARQHGKGAAEAAEEIRRQAQEEATKRAQATKAEEETQRRAERAREDPEAAKKRQREAQEWLAEKRKETLAQESKEASEK